MGADEFFTFGPGAKIEEAFDTAQRQAGYEHGHSYSGSLAEKHEYTVVAGDGGQVAPRYGRPYYPVSAFGGARQDREWPETEPVSLAQARATAGRLIEEDDARIADKWGPAGAIRVRDETKDGWLFFGIASS